MPRETRLLGDTQKPTCVICYWRGDPYDWTNATASFVLEELDGTAITEAGTITAHPTQTCTLDSTNNWIYCRGHGAKRGNQVVFATSGSLSGSGLTAGTCYIVVEVDGNWIKVSLSSNGVPITIAGAGTGTHTFYIVGSVQIAWATADIDSAEPYKLWIVSTVNSKTLTFPSDTDETAFEGITISVKAFGN